MTFASVQVINAHTTSNEKVKECASCIFIIYAIVGRHVLVIGYTRQ